MARARIAGLLTIGLLLTGCSQSHQVAPPGHDAADLTIDGIQSLGESQAPPRELGPSRPPPLIFIEYVATPHDVVVQMLKLAGVGPDDVVYDLGCGDGRILIAAAKKYGCRAVGFDLDPLRVEEARANAAKQGVADRVTVEQKDVLTVDLRAATVVTIYLGTELNRRLIPHLEQLPPGARIVSHNFGIGDFVPDKVIRMTSDEDHEEHLIYLWTGPLKKTE
jgi:SAM-dependent methyltransferase